MRHPDPAGCTLGSLLQAVNEHIHEEQTSILAYQRLGRTFADPVIAAVMQLILDDEARHHAAMQHIARTLNSALCWAPPPETTPLAAEDVSEAIRELRSLADEERRGVSALHELARRGRDRNDDLCAVLLDAMAMDSDKHARLLELVIRRLAAYAPKPLPDLD